MPNNSSGTNRSCGKWRCKFNQDLVVGFKLHPGKHQHAALTHVISSASHYFCGSFMGMNEPDRKVKPVPLPAPENCSFWRSLATWDRT
jgi:hypothetical protein